MIRLEDIFNQTNGGLDIIHDLYPNSRGCEGSSTKHFKIRNERTPSASLKMYKSDKYGDLWMVTDFGDTGKGEHALTLWMKEHGMDKSRFQEAILQIAARFNISDVLNRDVNKPDIRTSPATPDEKEGDRDFETKKFTKEELAILGPKVTETTVDSLRWLSVKFISYVKDRKKIIKYSNDHYPIFVRECEIEAADGGYDRFYKVYEPLNCDKAFRFSYFPAGKKPRYYINGLKELKAQYRKFNETEEKEWSAEHPDEHYKPKKLPEAVICSGERDALCCRSMGYHPLWFNSETYQLSGEEYKEIMQYVETLYNIPDLDETGKRKGRELALKYIDIHTIWLPEWLSSYKDHRGRPRKDLRDWMELRSEVKDFRNLMKLAMPAKFWTCTTSREGRTRYDIDTACLFNFLALNGFNALHDDNSSVTQYVRVEGNIVKKITVKDIRDFVTLWVKSRYEQREVLNLVLNTQRLASAALESLQEITLDFTSYTSRSQLFFFNNKTVEVSIPTSNNNGIRVYEPGADELKNYVWQDNVIDHRFSLLPDMFKITQTEDESGITWYDIDILNKSSHFFRYLINTSRIHWRKEMEYNFGDDTAKMDEYASNHRFDIAGDGLTDMEIREQKQNLVNKIFAFGYMLHHYKSPSRAWAPMAMDNKIGSEDECNGRSGKSFFFKVLSYLMKTVKLSGRNPKLMDNPHVFDQVTQHTDLLLLDDCDRYLNTGLFYDNITSDMTVNPKNNKSFSIPFEDSPKLAFTTNYVPSDFDPSSEARLIYMVFSDYYHQKTEENDYIDSRSIRDDFGMDLYGRSYSEEDWNDDINFWLQCCRFYLSMSEEAVKINPPMMNIVKRKYKADMGANFEDWATGYFSLEGLNLDKPIPRESVLNDYMNYSKVTRITTQSFTRKLKAFINLCPWIAELNPKELCNSSGRIQTSIDTGSGIRKTLDMIYLRSAGTPVTGVTTDNEQQKSLEGVIPF